MMVTEEMKVYKCESVSNGIALGKVYYYKKGDNFAKPAKIKDADEEVKRFEKAHTDTLFELESLYNEVKSKSDDNSAEIIYSHFLMLKDDDFVNEMIDTIRNENVNSEYAVYKTSEKFASALYETDDDYMKERASDVRDVGGRLINKLKGKKDLRIDENEKVILIASDLSPSETAGLDKNKIGAIITENGSPTSHTALLARGMGIPAAVGAGGIGEYSDGKIAAFDGESGILYISPDEKTIKSINTKYEESRKRKEYFESLKGKESINENGKRICLYANIGSVAEAYSALENDAEGIGLFRSEFIFMDKKPPSEEEQFRIYKEILSIMKNKRVIVRTLDAGSDKNLPYLNMEKEENPALGLRGIRISFREDELFRVQIRALLRASSYGELYIMFPMINTLSEFIRAKNTVLDEKKNLERENINVSENVKIGMMVETPASALAIDDFMNDSDFFSIGTNDLCQYVLACDRTNSLVYEYSDYHNKALLGLIRSVLEKASANGKFVGICGEMAGDLSLTQDYINWGASELSVSPSRVLALRASVRNEGIEFIL